LPVRQGPLRSRKDKVKIMGLSKNILAAIDKNPVTVPVQAGSIPCALQPFGCSGMVSPDRVVVWLADGTGLGNCPNYVRHTAIVREAGPGSEAQKVFSWLIGQFQKANPGRVRGDKSPITALDLRKQAATA
jgi:hypothetical protein